MRVLVPYTSLRDEVIAPLREQTDLLELVDVSGDPTAYWRMLRDAWATAEDFAIVEHDVIVPPGTIAGFETCKRPWCGSCDPYSDPRFPTSSFLQCVRFRSSLMKAWPGLFDAMPEFARHWLGLDLMFLPRLEARGFREHNHKGTRTRHLKNHSADEMERRMLGFMRWVAPFAEDGRRFLGDLHVRLSTATPLERRDGDVFARRASQASLLVGYGIENMTDAELRARVRLPAA